MKTLIEIYNILPTNKKLYEFIFKIEKENDIKILNILRRSFYLLDNDNFYIYEGLIEVCDLMGTPLMKHYTIRKGKNNLPSRTSIASMYPANGDIIEVSGLEALIIVKIILMNHLDWEFKDEEYYAYIDFKCISRSGCKILD